MTKAGSIYEQLVADIMSTMSPGASVVYGRWTKGPDGRTLPLHVQQLFNITKASQTIPVLNDNHTKRSIGQGFGGFLDEYHDEQVHKA